MFRIISLSLAAMALGGLPGISIAAESYDNCTGFINSVPATIVTQGTWCLIQSPGSVIRGNLVIDTGSSTSSTSTAYGINAAEGVDIIDNTVIGVAPGGANANAIGIGSNFNGDGSITGNRVRGLAANGTGLALGIYNTNSGRIVIRDNDVQGTGSAGSVGIRCITNQGTARGNVISGFDTSLQNCLSSSNTTNTN